MQGIFKQLTIIQKTNPKTHINFKKVKSHSDIQGNNTIDKLVRNCAKRIKYKQNHLQYTSYQISLTQVHKFINKSGKSTGDPNQSKPP